MAHSLADALYERLLSSFPATRAYTRADWDDDAMPGPVAHFLDQLLQHHSRREVRRLRRASTDWVNYDAPEMETAVRTFFDTMEAHTCVPADEWEDTLRQATHHSTAHLVRPVHMLTDFVYAERQKQLRLSKILWRMKFFGPYTYLREAVQAFAKKHDLDVLGPDRFERFLHRIDERITDSYDADRWLQLLTPLFAVAHRATGEETVPTTLLQTFFAEKGRKALEWELEDIADKGHDRVSPQELHRVIEQVDDASAEPTDSEERPGDRGPSPPDPAPSDSAPSDPPPAESPPSTEDVPDPSPSDPDDEIWGVAGAAQPEGTAARQAEEGQQNRQGPTGDDQSVPLWKRFQGGHAGATARGGNANEQERTGESGNAQEPLWARFRHERDERLSDAVADEGAETEPSEQQASTSSPSESNASPPGASLHEASRTAADGTTSSSARGGATDLDALEQQALGGGKPPHRAVYIRQLFGGDQSAYQHVLQRLADADSWSEASQIIASDIFRKHKVNIYSDAAVHFTNAVESRFREE
jgi:hypothetical protein